MRSHGERLFRRKGSIIDGSWTGTGPIKYSYQWQHCDPQGANCADLADDVESNVILRSEDVGTTVRVQVSARNGGGVSAAYSAASSVVAANAPASVYAPKVSGKPTVGTTLSAVDGEWDGSTPMTYQYQWLRCSQLLPAVPTYSYRAGSGRTVEPQAVSAAMR